ncbi:MAG: tyrosine--tRNA ligase [bacterium]
MINKDPKKIEEVLTRGVENVYPAKDALKKFLLAGNKLVIYNGIDPTGDLHLGHSVVLNKLRQFQELGHEIILLIGDFTGQVGDPTDKKAARKPLTHEQVLANANNYQKIIGKILDLKKTKFDYNSKWWNKMSLPEFFTWLSQVTVARVLERDMFQERMKKGADIHMHELMYPILQGVDCIKLGVNMEIGGNDQTFNMLFGRTLMAKQGKEKFVLATKLLVDPSGKKMGKTEGNAVDLTDNPKEMFGKIMSWPDGVIVLAFEICAQAPMAEINGYEAQLKSGQVNPRDLKAKLAWEIVKIYHGEKEASGAAEEFDKIFKNKEKPEEIKEVKAKSDNLVDVLVETKLAPSKSEARRLVLQGGIKVDDKVVKGVEFKVKRGATIQKGKRFFIKIK